MDSRVRAINRVVKAHDSALFAQREMNGAIHVYRKTSNPADPMQLVFAVTDNWNVTGKPREWGLTVIEARLQAIDIWKSETVFDRLDEQFKRSEESNERDLKNNIESFLLEFRGQFARATDGINTSGLSKYDRRSQLGA